MQCVLTGWHFGEAQPTSIFHTARLLHSVYIPTSCFGRHGTLWRVIARTLLTDSAISRKPKEDGAKLSNFRSWTENGDQFKKQ
jgi:hypothetical protein